MPLQSPATPKTGQNVSVGALVGSEDGSEVGSEVGVLLDAADSAVVMEHNELARSGNRVSEHSKAT